jgi:sugar O-acyltransferase (sialic acid O-acetyltransferase NeuD family)
MPSLVKVIVIGAGGQGLIVTDALLCAAAAGSPVRPVALLDDDATRHGRHVLGVPVLGAVRTLPEIPHDAIIVAIGDNRIRRDISQALVESGERLAVARHPSAVVSPSAQIGEGAMISAGVVVSPLAVIGRGVLLNTCSSVDHETTVGDFAHVSAGATVGANVSIGEEVLVALGAAVTSGRRVGARSIVGAGAVVVSRDVPADVTVFGVPARIRSGRRSPDREP